MGLPLLPLSDPGGQAGRRTLCRASWRGVGHGPQGRRPSCLTAIGKDRPVGHTVAMYWMVFYQWGG